MKLEMRLRNEDLFDGLDSEERNNRDRDIEYSENPVLEEMVRGFEFVIKKDTYVVNNVIPYIYKVSEDHLLEKYTSRDIEKFSVLLGDYQYKKYFNSRLGLYLSALINNSEEEDFKIHTGYLENPPDWLGYKNNGKKIIVNGSVDDCVGFCMQRGEIIVNGNVGRFAGICMLNGIIRLNGDHGEFTGISGGDIYHNGKLIVKDGRKLK